MREKAGELRVHPSPHSSLRLPESGLRGTHLSEALSYRYHQECGCSHGSTKTQTVFITALQVSKTYKLLCRKTLLGNSKMKVKDSGSALAAHAGTVHVSKLPASRVIYCVPFSMFTVKKFEAKFIARY